MTDIFISYAHEDRPRAQVLAQTLEDQRWSIFWDRTIPIGKTWRETIGKELGNARCVIVLWSKTSIESGWVQEEADDAKRRGILVPILIEDVQPPFGFRSIQTADLADWDATEPTKAFRRLIFDIAVLIGAPPKEAERKEDERKRADSEAKLEAEARRQAEEEAQRLEAEAKRKAEEEQHRREAEAKARQQAEERPLILRPDVAKALDEIAAEVEGFKPKRFLYTARAAYKMTVTAYAEGDCRTLKTLLAREVYNGFEAAIRERETRGETVETRFVSINPPDIIEAKLRGKIAQVTIRFVAQLVSVTRDKNDVVKDGNPDKVTDVTDVWTFARDATSRVPNWKLIATEAPQ
jgi:predicted lipid-binding transport protein (Tim44 family)